MAKNTPRKTKVVPAGSGLSVFLDSAVRLLGADAVLTEPAEIQNYASDWTRTPGAGAAVVFPRSTAQVATLLKLCSDHKVAVVPSGGRTGLAGGAVALGSEILLSLSRMTGVQPVDTLARSITVQAGVTTATVHELAAQHGLRWPIDLASKGSSTIGGNLATNAGGLRVIRYGMARKWVSGLQVVSAQGEVVDLNRGLQKNNTGYDLIQLFLGSEGTLGVITEATLKLTTLPGQTTVLLVGVDSLSGLLDLYGATAGAPFTVEACEFFSDRCLQAVSRRLGRKSRFPTSFPYYLLFELELSDHPHAKDRLGMWLERQMSKGLLADGYIAESSEMAAEMWGLREGITESLQLSGAVRKYDVCVPVQKFAAFLNSVLEWQRGHKPCFELFLFGHLADASPHLNLLKNPEASASQFEKDWQRFEAHLYPLLVSFDGSVSSEHGIGCLKKNWLPLSRSPLELEWFRGIKKTFDPLGILNPGKIL